MYVPAPGSGRVPQKLIHVSLPVVLLERIEDLIRQDGSANSIPDFVRQSTVKEVERRTAGRAVPDEGAEKTLRRTRSA